MNWKIGLEELQKINFDIAERKNYYNQGMSELEFHSLLHREISEATEAHIKKEKPYIIKDGKPEGEAVELTDVMIMIMNYFSYKGWDLIDIMEKKMAYNNIREKRDGLYKHKS